MLTQLSIKNYALIDDLQVNFNNGLSIITGETGAGKSILLGGLSLILGKRADLSSIKDNSKKCVIEATFDIAKYNLKVLFKSEDLDYEAVTIIRREILPSGKSRAFINDTPVNLDSLQVLGEHLLDIHSQHQTLQLTNDDFQFQVIDALADNLKLLNGYQQELQSFKALDKELKALQAQKAEAIKELDYNLFLLKELTDANLVAGELESLEEEYETLNNVEEIKEKLAASHELMSNEEVGITLNLTEVKNQFAKLATMASQYKVMYERVSSSLIELADIFSEMESLQDQLEADPNRLELVNAKLQVLNNLSQKHSVASVEELIAIREDLKSKVEITENLDEAILAKEKQIASVEKQLNQIAKELHDKRLAVIPKLVSQLESILGNLGMPNAKFQVELQTRKGFLANGTDALAFLFSANKGGQFNELKKAASGGELSRIMLAIKSVLAKYTHLPTLMFDEIDTGVSGEISNKMGAIMQQMSKKMQVFSITHLPQIAAKGDTHYKVYKEDVNNVTQTQMKQLTAEERIVEIAQMLGGKDISSSAMAHAKELLN
ncbi:DNA repair protein RecN [Subsaximicrobium wynnwilliamsii]|uniref:DNA repair protein RecN n=1 Tax=Subsaximicrobium wynnwilliamsii TaxID=291179 RepID=A0A5C6ZQN6_9FLAO|nr:DNA repair protein RecN [Subsaximicrobium wynnwilliamsii]TXD85160.1 DNA repair protein RecN [Subsaximicrobium wynnwilliamsii]TXD91203.1 DNA repair protein RecN [Subsaximicrobium wynnwilliamsii]TXE04597.1 DNA repair protein RecN [Subsaximicrobium wynnwilliamsii]